MFEGAQIVCKYNLSDMYNYSNNGITIASILDTRRVQNNGKYPVKIRITYNRVRKYYSTGKDSTKKEWESLPNSKSKHSQLIKNDIQFSFDKIKSIVLDLERKDKFTLDNFNQRLSRGNSDTINTAFHVKIEALRENEQIGSQFFYRDALRSFEKFAGENIKFSDITVDWLQKYEQYFIGLGRSYTTLGMYCRGLRHIMNQAKKDGIIKESQYPFGVGKYNIPKGSSRKMALTMNQIKDFVSYSDGSDATEKYRDLWFFSYLCNGINFGDMLRLKYSNIVNGEIYFVRSKTSRTSNTKKEVCVIVTPEMENIINKWGNKDKSHEKNIFPYLTGKESALEGKKKIQYFISACNKRLKMISEAIGVQGISTYTARHSYATVLKRSGANIAYISESLGHSDLKTTENYLASFERDEREKNAKLLTDFGE